MDNWLKFQYLVKCIISWGLTRWISQSSLLNWSAEISTVMIGKSVVAFIWYGAKSTERWVILINNLQEKVRNEYLIKPYRKPTQVGWSRRLRWARERSLRNSAKKLPVTSGDGLPLFIKVAPKVCYSTVYQKHRSLQKRKLKYRGWRLPSAGKLRGGVLGRKIKCSELKLR